MTRRLRVGHRLAALAGLLLAVFPCRIAAEAPPKAAVAFDAYVQNIEVRLAKQHTSPAAFVAPLDFQRIRQGELVVERLTPNPEPEMPGAMLHHWRGTAFAPGATIPVTS